jgi:hypothetical protein
VASRTVTGRLAKKLAMSFVATAVTGVAGYAGKKAPQLIEDKLMPKLREATLQRHPGGEAEEPAHARLEKQHSPAQRDARRRQRIAQREARRTGSGAKED